MKWLDAAGRLYFTLVHPADDPLMLCCAVLCCAVLCAAVVCFAQPQGGCASAAAGAVSCSAAQPDPQQAAAGHGGQPHAGALLCAGSEQEKCGLGAATNHSCVHFTSMAAAQAPATA